jgi:hypothetical protein
MKRFVECFHLKGPGNHQSFFLSQLTDKLDDLVFVVEIGEAGFQCVRQRVIHLE